MRPHAVAIVREVNIDRQTWQIGAEVDWIANATTVGATITAAIPPILDAYATNNELDDAAAFQAVHEPAVVQHLVDFTTTPFQNWIHSDAAVTGQVRLAAAWRIPIDDVRAELTCVLHASPHWDGRCADLVVNDASGPAL